MNNKNNDAAVDKFLKKIEDGVTELFKTGQYQNILDYYSKFHNYSYNNTIAILMQKPEATLCAGFNFWKKNERTIKKGEKGISILVPYKVKFVLDNNGNRIYKTDYTEQIKKQIEKDPNYEKHYIKFGIGYTFDVGQTEGKELPKLVEYIKGASKKTQKYIDILTKTIDIPVKFEDLKQESLGGYYNLTDKEIVINKNKDLNHNLRTLIHEISHYYLHSQNPNQKGYGKIHFLGFKGEIVESIEYKTKEEFEKEKKESFDVGRSIKSIIYNNKGIREVQAESIAYIVSKKIGLETSSYSFGYIASYSDTELNELKESQSIIKETAKKIINNIEKELELTEEKEKKKKTSIKKNNSAVKTRKKELEVAI